MPTASSKACKEKKKTRPVANSGFQEEMRSSEIKWIRTQTEAVWKVTNGKWGWGVALGTGNLGIPVLLLVGLKRAAAGDAAAGDKAATRKKGASPPVSTLVP